jgi:hypothetical protein
MTSMGASVCLDARIPIGTNVERCQTLQSETQEAWERDLRLEAVVDVRPLLSNLRAGSAQTGSAVLKASQLATIATMLKALLSLRAQLLPAKQAPGTSDTQRAAALAVHAAQIDPGLQRLLEVLLHSIDVVTCEVLDRCSAPLATVRRERRANQQLLAQEMQHWCRELHRQGASELKAPVIRRDRQCCSVKRGRSGVCSLALLPVPAAPCRTSNMHAPTHMRCFVQICVCMQCRLHKRLRTRHACSAGYTCGSAHDTVCSVCIAGCPWRKRLRVLHGNASCDVRIC